MRWTALVLVASASALAACAGSSTTRSEPEVARREPARPEPRRAPPQPQPLDDRQDLQGRYRRHPAVDVTRGRASYYSDRLAGNRTASGDVYDPRAFTAATRDLPFGTILRVVREDTGASVIVRVNDRGPFRDHSRILDLSRAAAEALGMIRAGVVQVRAEILERPARR